MIAATATVHNLIVATRNIRDYRQFKVKTFNPFSTPSD
jgi:predicted nucleic acid-binding protein